MEALLRSFREILRLVQATQGGNCGVLMIVTTDTGNHCLTNLTEEQTLDVLHSALDSAEDGLTPVVEKAN